MEDDLKQNSTKNIHLRSDEISEIMGIPPRWVVRWGITIIFIVIATVFIGSAFFRYPDIVSATVTITSENPVSVLISKANGKIAKINYPDNSVVSKNDTIAIIDNPAKSNDIVFLTKILKGVDAKTLNTESITKLHLPDSLVLGEIQNAYNNFARAYFEVKLYQSQKFHFQKIKAIEGEIKQYKLHYNRLWSQRNLTVKDLELSQKQFARDSQLFESGVIAAADYEKSQAVILSKRQMLENARLNLSNTTITIEKLKQNIIETKIEQESQSKKLIEDLTNRLSELISSLSSWEKNYLLVAPSSGTLNYMGVWSDLQEVRSGDKLFTINPEKRGAIFAQLTIPAEGIGKVKVGQRVTIKLDGYPYVEFGVIEGFVQSIASGSVEKGYPAVVTLPNGVVTSYGDALTLDREHTGIADISTEEMSVLRRLFNPLKYLLNDRVKKNPDEK